MVMVHSVKGSLGLVSAEESGILVVKLPGMVVPACYVRLKGLVVLGHRSSMARMGWEMCGSWGFGARA